MKLLKQLICTVWFMLLLNTFSLVISNNDSVTWPHAIHAFGDSHAVFWFTGHSPRSAREHCLLSHCLDSKEIIIPCVINWLGPKTMYNIGCKGITSELFSNIREGDNVIFIFGEIDVRCHIGKQRDQVGRNLDEIISSLCQNYIDFIARTKRLFNNVNFIVGMVPPPTDCGDHPDYPRWGTLADRIVITNKVNMTLKNICSMNGICFFDVYDKYSTEAGSLRSDLSDGSVHIRDNHYLLEQLFTILMAGI